MVGGTCRESSGIMLDVYLCAVAESMPWLLGEKPSSLNKEHHTMKFQSGSLLQSCFTEADRIQHLLDITFERTLAGRTGWRDIQFCTGCYEEAR